MKSSSVDDAWEYAVGVHCACVGNLGVWVGEGLGLLRGRMNENPHLYKQSILQAITV